MSKISVLFRSQQKTHDFQLHGDAELTIARLYPHHAGLALEGLVFEIVRKAGSCPRSSCALSVSKKSSEVLMSHVVPIPSFNCTGRASLKRSPLRLSSKPPAPPTVARTMAVIPGENN